MSVLIKICGLSTPDALDVALDAGADMVGFVFFPPSPRHIDHDAARALGAQVHGRAQKVALSVDADDAELAAAIAALKPDLLQLHGKETPERVAAVRSRFGLPVMKALAISERSDLAAIRLYDKVADRLIFDARAAARRHPAGRPRPIVRLESAAELETAIPYHAVGRTRRRQCRRGLAHHAGAGRRCVVRRRAGARREGSPTGSAPSSGPCAPRGAVRQSENHE